MRHLPAHGGGGRCDTKIFRGCSATLVLHLQNAKKSRKWAATRVARHVQRDRGYPQSCATKLPAGPPSFPYFVWFFLCPHGWSFAAPAAPRQQHRKEAKAQVHEDVRRVRQRFEEAEIRLEALEGWHRCHDLRLQYLEVPLKFVLKKFKAQYYWTTGARDNGNEWRKFRAVPRLYPLRSLVCTLYGGPFVRSYSVLKKVQSCFSNCWKKFKAIFEVPKCL